MQKQLDLVDLLQLLDGEGGLDKISSITLDTLSNFQLNQIAPFLLMLNIEQYNFEHVKLLEQLSSLKLINFRIVDLLQEPSYKPRITRVGETILLTLKFYQPISDAHPHLHASAKQHNQLESDQKISTELIKTLKICINEKLILLLQDTDLIAIDNLQLNLIQQEGIKRSAEALIFLLEEMTQLFSEYIEDLHDDILTIEEKLLESELTDRTELISIRKSLTILRRNLASIKDLVSRLAIEKLHWLAPDDHQQLHDLAEHLRRELEEVDACIARTGIVSEELNTLITDNINKRLYIMSIVTVIFMPVTFITGLFGVNLGGIPGNESLGAFAGFSTVIITVLVIIIFMLKIKKWF